MSRMNIDLSKKETIKLMSNGKVEKILNNKMYVITIPDNIEADCRIALKSIIID